MSILEVWQVQLHEGLLSSTMMGAGIIPHMRAKDTCGIPEISRVHIIIDAVYERMLGYFVISEQV